MFCGLTLENTDHLLRACRVDIEVWRLVESIADTKINLLAMFAGGEWLDFNINGNSKYVASIIAATLWQIWKSRCKKIFR